MKKIISILTVLTLFVLSIMSTSVIADSSDKFDEELKLLDDEAVGIEADEILNSDSVVEAGVTPDNFLWGFERAMENVNLAFTFDSASKSKKRLEFANERLAEAKVMAEQNQIEGLEKAQLAHKEELTKLKESLDKVEKSDKVEEVKLNKEIEKDLIEQEKVASALAAKVELKIKGDLSDEQIQKLMAFVESLKSESAQAKVEVSSNQDKIKLKLRALNSLSEDEVDELEDQVEVEVEAEDDNGKGPEVVAKNFIRIAQKAIEQATERVGDINTSSNISDNKTRAMMHLKNATELLAKAKSAYEEKDYATVKELAYQARREAHNAIVASLGQEVTSENRGSVKDQIVRLPIERMDIAKDIRQLPAEDRVDRLIERIGESPASFGEVTPVDVQSIRGNSGHTFRDKPLGTPGPINKPGTDDGQSDRPDDDLIEQRRPGTPGPINKPGTDIGRVDDDENPVGIGVIMDEDDEFDSDSDDEEDK